MNRFTSILFTILIAELALGGGGRLIAYGPISLRMILFALALLVSLIHFIRGQRIPRDYWILLSFFTFISGLALIIGIYSGAQRIYWWEDIKPLLYFLILPFFYFAVANTGVVERTVVLFKTTGVSLALIFFLILILIHSGVLPFLNFYNTVIGTEEFFFRGELSFTYKGFLFLCIGFIFIHFTGGRYKFLWMSIVLIAIVFTVTRGFWFALVGIYSVYYFSSSKSKSIVFALLALSVLITGQIIISKTSETIDQVKSSNTDISNLAPKSTLLGDRNFSDEGRFQQIKEVAEQVSFSSILVGHGFGNGTISRPVHMEISYLEIFHKQGLIGLAFWTYLLWLLYVKYRAATLAPLRSAFFFSSLFIYIQSLTNQYVNNPIGLSMILLSMVCLDRLDSSKT